MSLRLVLAAGLLLSSVPAFTQSLHETHVKVPMPAGKTVHLYRPINQDDCRAAKRHHQAGKMPLTVVADSDACAAIAAKREARKLASRD